MRLLYSFVLAAITLPAFAQNGPAPAPDADQQAASMAVAADQTVSQHQQRVEKLEKQAKRLKAKIRERQNKLVERQGANDLHLVILDTQSESQRDKLVLSMANAGLGPVMATDAADSNGNYPVVLGVYMTEQAAQKRRQSVRAKMGSESGR